MSADGDARVSGSGPRSGAGISRPAADSPAARIKAQALVLGFEAAGIARVEPLEASAHYDAWLAAGGHGDMAWLATERHRTRRADPLQVLAGLQSVVCVALAYPPARDPARDRRLGQIARYAAGEDYHRIMRDKLRALETFVREVLPGAATVWYSDTGAILERGWAERAGLGWIAKNTCMIGPRLGSYTLLGELLVDRPLDPDSPFAHHHCGTCTRCIEACPTGAILGPQRLDARRCISYLTIELRGPIPRDLRRLVGDWIFGCDVCQDVCPWNRFAPPAREARLHARRFDGWSLETFLGMDDATFRTVFADSPIRRARREGFLRNVCVALGNRGDADAVPALLASLRTDPAPLVRMHAAWALGEIGRRTAVARVAVLGALATVARGDPDGEVQAEARAARAQMASAEADADPRPPD